MIRARLIALSLAVAAVIGIGASTASASVTQAAWTDRVHISAAATSGEWTVENTCTAVDPNGVARPCAVGNITYSPWDGTTDSLHFHVALNVNGNPDWVTFTVDLATAVPENGPALPAWAWRGATIRPGGSFTPAEDWTCSRLPVVSGTAHQGLRYTEFVVNLHGDPADSGCP